MRAALTVDVRAAGGALAAATSADHGVLLHRRHDGRRARPAQRLTRRVAPRTPAPPSSLCSRLLSASRSDSPASAFHIGP
eukprot:156805-Pleurochrysis_carterae.AAC.1